VTSILIIDDDHDIVETLSECLTANGYEVLTAYDGMEGLGKYEKYRPSLILTDIYMPRINGVELMKRIRHGDNEIPIIVFSAGATVPDAVMLVREYIASDVLCKPVDRVALLRSVRDALAQRHQSPLKRLLSPSTDASESVKEKQGEGDLNEDKVADYKMLMAALAHDLKNEFSRMALITRNLVQSRSLDQEEMTAIKLGVEYGQMIVRRFLNFLDMGLSPPQPINIVEIARKAEDIVRPRLRPNIRLAVVVDVKSAMEDFKVIANPEQLQLILVDLIRNAGEAIGSESGVITLKVKEVKNTAEILVSDNGPGIPPSLTSQLFETPLKRQGGLGLGLYLAARIVRSWKGQIILLQTTKRGTTFAISLQRVFIDPSSGFPLGVTSER
jgi:signal transduction histidine kinase